MTARDEIVAFLDEELDVRSVEDESMNGLQVQGRGEVEKVALATDAALKVYRRAADLGCGMVVAHHGILWSKLTPITGVLHDHVRFLLEGRINLYAAHLPLDLHPRLGNNAELARMAGVREPLPFGRYHGKDIGFMGGLEQDLPLDELAGRLAGELGASPVVLPFGSGKVGSVGIVSGGGAFCLSEAIEKRLDCFVTGEGAHWNHHLALEAGIDVIYLGHYHSETPGVKAVGALLEERFGLGTVFIDEPTIV
ncbi:MAG: Nif3-like dinuclear metal center hexameric protein [Deltaproteobacteria bacterium]|nr:Nif3-like dinuclear metal center hexameric protein [Deltaproteobacteria bacterium]